MTVITNKASFPNGVVVEDTNLVEFALTIPTSDKIFSLQDIVFLLHKFSFLDKSAKNFTHKQMFRKWLTVIENQEKVQFYAKNGQIGNFLKTWSLRSNSVTRQVNYKTFISWKVCGNPKNRTCGHPKNPRIQRKLCGLFHVANSSLNHSVWKSLKMSHLENWIMAFFDHFFGILCEM